MNSKAKQTTIDNEDFSDILSPVISEEEAAAVADAAKKTDIKKDKKVQNDAAPLKKTKAEKPVKQTAKNNTEAPPAELNKAENAKSKAKKPQKKSADSQKNDAEKINSNAENSDSKPAEKSKSGKGGRAFGIIISLLISAASVYLFIREIDFSKFNIATDYMSLLPLAPLLAQLIVGLIVIIALGNSKGRDVKIVYKEKVVPCTEKSDSPAETVLNSEQKQTLRADLFEPEVKAVPRRAPKLDGNFKIENFYKSDVEVINGNLYANVAKFDEAMRAFASMGATDMELIKVNMTGNTKFDEILDLPRNEKTLTSAEAIAYFMSKPGTYTIKKRGTLNWTFKYSFKSFGIIREGQGRYKVSVKCFPDAAAKLNESYKALEDSNFPSGPLWFCFNELRNTPPRVVKWLIDTSYQISQMQQTKNDKLRVFRTPADMDIDLPDITARFKNGERVLTYPKFTLVFSAANEADYKVYLSDAPENTDTKSYTKEIYYKLKNGKDAVSFLCGKGVSDDMICTFIEHIDEINM